NPRAGAGGAQRLTGRRVSTCAHLLSPMQNGPHSGPRRGAAAPLAAGLSHVARETPWLCALPSPAVRPLQRINSPAYSPGQNAAVMGVTRWGAKLASDTGSRPE